jgi:hypothetical protein
LIWFGLGPAEPSGADGALTGSRMPAEVISTTQDR